MQENLIDFVDYIYNMYLIIYRFSDLGNISITNTLSRNVNNIKEQVRYELALFLRAGTETSPTIIKLMMMVVMVVGV